MPRVWIAQKNDILPFPDSAPYAAFQGFATAMVRADMDTVGKFADEESIKKQASDTFTDASLAHQVPAQAHSDMSLDSGTRLGQYEVTAFIGSGRVGEAWRARDTKLNRDADGPYHRSAESSPTGIWFTWRIK